jgi:hypothetical protein
MEQERGPPSLGHVIDALTSSMFSDRIISLSRNEIDMLITTYADTRSGTQRSGNAPAELLR